MLRVHVSLACKTRAHKQDMETSGSDSELEWESGLDQASGSTSAMREFFLFWRTPSPLTKKELWKTIFSCQLCSSTIRDSVFKCIIEKKNSENNLRIIGSFLKNNRLKFWESRNRIMGEILSIISQSLAIDRAQLVFVQSQVSYCSTKMMLNVVRELLNHCTPPTEAIKCPANRQ